MTLIEAMSVIAVIGILSAISIPSYIKYREKGRIAVAVTEIILLDKELKNYQIDKGDYPESLGEIPMGIQKDPWGNDYQYLKIAGNNKGQEKMRKDRNLVPVNSDFDLFSKGKDGQSQSPFTAKASQDDIVRANNGRYVGLVSNY